MPQPTPYAPEFSFTDFQAANPSVPLPAFRVDAELAGLDTTLDGVLANLALIQRDDGKLRDGVVTVDAVDAQLLATLGAAAADAAAPQIQAIATAASQALIDDAVADDAPAASLVVRSAAKVGQLIAATIANVARIAVNRAALASTALSPVPVYLVGEGWFEQDASNLQAKVTADTAKGIYVPPTGQDGSTGAWVRRITGPINAGWFGFVEGDDRANGPANTAAFSALQATLAAREVNVQGNNHSQERVLFPYGVYWFADSGTGACIEVNRGAFILEGHSPGFNRSGTALKFPAGTTLIRVQDQQSSGTNTKDAVAHAQSQGMTFRNLLLRGEFDTALVEGEFHGIQARTTITCEGVEAQYCQGDGFNLCASVGAATGANPPYGNANESKFFGCVSNNNRNGIKFDGTDANACNLYSFKASANRRAGIFDSSLIGNSVYGGALAGNGTTAYNDGVTIPATVVSYNGNRYGVIARQEVGASANAPSGDTTDNAYWYYMGVGGPVSGRPAWFNGISVRSGGCAIVDELTTNGFFSGVYTETDQGKAQVSQGVLVLGGVMAGWLFNNPTANRGGSVLRAGTNGTLDTLNCFQAFSGTVNAKLGASNGNSLNIILNGSEPTYSPAGHQIRFANLSGGGLLFTYGSSSVPSVYAYYLTGPNSTEQFGTGAGQPHTLYAPRLALGPVVAGAANARRIFVDSAAPVAGDHGDGEFIHARSATVGLIGWICRAAGAPGTWEALYGLPAAPSAIATSGDAADLANGARVLAQSAVAASHTGDTAEATLATITIPAGAMGANGRIEIRARFSFTGAAGAKTPRIRLGGTQIFGVSPAAAITLYRVNAEVANRNAQNSQHVETEAMNSAAATVIAMATQAIDTSLAQDITITGQLASAADTIKLESYQVLMFKKA